MDEERLAFIFKRRSIRKFEDRPVPPDLITAMLKAAMAAPSARNAQPWEFVVITDPQVKEAIAAAHPYATMATAAPVVFVVCGDRDNKWMWQDCAAATENLLLAAANLGLGAVWCGLMEERERAVREIIGLPERLWAFSLVPCGYPAEEKPPRTQFDPRKVHWNKY